jgi:hypothetical protein
MTWSIVFLRKVDEKKFHRLAASHQTWIVVGFDSEGPLVVNGDPNFEDVPLETPRGPDESYESKMDHFARGTQSIRLLKKRKQKDVPNPNHLSIDNVRSSSSRSQISSPLDPIAHHSTIFSSCEIPFLPLISTYFNHDQWVSPVYAQRPLSVATCCWVQSDPT